MDKIIVVIVLLAISSMSCKNPETKIDRLEIAKKYYAVLDNSDDSAIADLLTESILMTETEYDYEETFSMQEYQEWLRWDAIFEPTYEILHIEEEDEMVKAKISKIDKRILFLHEEPIVMHQIVRFDEDKITSVETAEYIVFNDSIFVKNRDALLRWIEKNHPELSGFINERTEVSALKYLKAIELYQNRN